MTLQQARLDDFVPGVPDKFKRSKRSYEKALVSKNVIFSLLYLNYDLEIATSKVQSGFVFAE